MLLQVKDASGTAQVVVVQAQDQIYDRSGVIAATNTSAPLMPANPNRSGFYFQNAGENNGGSAITINELAGDATAVNSWVIPLGGTFPPPGYPIPTGAINIAGVQGDAYVAREW